MKNALILVILALSLLSTGCIDNKHEQPIFEDSAGGLPVWDDDPCSTAVPRGNYYQDVMGRWSQQVDASPFEQGRTVFTGSSSIRFWERLVEDLGAWAPVQRGFGGAITWDVAEWVEEAVTRHDPDAVVLFVGTNDIAAGFTPELIADAYRCVVERITRELGKVSISYISITPTPARWASWPQADAANQLIAAIAADWPDLHFIDTSPAFLSTGQPPDAGLFLQDGLHLSETGYAIWRDLVASHLEATVPYYIQEVSPLATGARILVDLGPSNPEDGEHTPSPDSFGQYWNNWAPVAGGTLLYSGEQVGELVDSTGAATRLRLVLSSANHQLAGVAAGGLLAPDPGLLGSLAVPTATKDFFFILDTTTVLGSRGALAVEGLDPDARYGLRLFASASNTVTQTTRFTVSGTGALSSANLTTSGADIGTDGTYDGNDYQILEFTNLAPDASGRLHLDYEPVAGTTAYLSLLELTVE